MKILTLAAILLLVSSTQVGWWHHKSPRKAGTDVLSVYYCGFGGNFCGQSTDNDVYPKTTLVILAFANTLSDGSIIMDEVNFPTLPYNDWKASGKNVLISVGGQNGNWGNVFASNTSATNFVNSAVDIVKRFNLDGVDLDI